MAGSYRNLVRLLIVFALALPALQSCAQTRTDSTGKSRLFSARADGAKFAADSIRQGKAGTAQTTSDDATEHMLPKRFQPNPKKAGLYSSIVPGLGQLYNHEYWKIPVVYAGIGIAAYFVGRNLNLYQSYRQAYIGRINNPSPTDKYVGVYSDAQLQQLQNDYSKYLDLTVLLTTVGYGLQVLDAVTSAHLKNFDISRDISMKLRPLVTPNFAGLTLTLRYRPREGMIRIN
jgi:Family of unknown function (DUF5683)